ncbi:acyltransferase family protein [Levilactobacillus huananensis]|uniref:acyltransferase family protein n=1 Tax=Levilactobacillus huananensis TaxID=2486019 RepID=UPI000F77A6FA|nr:acyltransferase [Levilactobacillus huananensis]
MNWQGDEADAGDFLKVAACTAVMGQSVLSLALTVQPALRDQAVMAGLYLAVKFTAPAFIWGILFTTSRTTQSISGYGTYLKQQIPTLFLPTVIWTGLYLWVMPDVQQHGAGHSWRSFFWQAVSGNAAPHLWYNTMMLQFILLMPVFWWLRDRTTRLQAAKHWGWGIGSLSVLAMIGFTLLVYPTRYFVRWYLLDRIFLGFLLYAVLGVLCWQYWAAWQHWLSRIWGLLVLVACATWGGQNWVLRQWGSTVDFAQTSYYLPATVIFDLSVIGLVLALAGNQIRRRSRSLGLVHGLAQLAYPSYLANVFWLQLIWRGGGAVLTQAHLGLGILVCYGLTWIVSFSFSALIARCIDIVKRRRQPWTEHNR